MTLNQTDKVVCGYCDEPGWPDGLCVTCAMPMSGVCVNCGGRGTEQTRPDSFGNWDSCDACEGTGKGEAL